MRPISSHFPSLMRYPALTRPESITLTSLQQQQQQETNQLFITNIVYAVPASGGFLTAELINKILPVRSCSSELLFSASGASTFSLRPTINHYQHAF